VVESSAVDTSAMNDPGVETSAISLGSFGSHRSDGDRNDGKSHQ
jgi:hypothetical protein